MARSMKGRFYLIFTAVIFGVVIFVGCNASEVSLIPPISDGMRTYQEFVSTVSSFPYNAPIERQKKIVSNYPNLKIGMSKNQVAEIIGDPDFTYYLHAKEPPGKFVGSTWTYFFFKPNPETSNEKEDRGVYIHFDTKDKASWIFPQHIEGLKEIKKDS